MFFLRRRIYIPLLSYETHVCITYFPITLTEKNVSTQLLTYKAVFLKNSLSWPTCPHASSSTKRGGDQSEHSILSRDLNPASIKNLVFQHEINILPPSVPPNPNPNSNPDPNPNPRGRGKGRGRVGLWLIYLVGHSVNSGPVQQHINWPIDRHGHTLDSFNTRNDCCSRVSVSARICSGVPAGWSTDNQGHAVETATTVMVVEHVSHPYVEHVHCRRPRFPDCHYTSLEHSVTGRSFIQLFVNLQVSAQNRDFLMKLLWLMRLREFFLHW